MAKDTCATRIWALWLSNDYGALFMDNLDHCLKKYGQHIDQLLYVMGEKHYC